MTKAEANAAIKAAKSQLVNATHALQDARDERGLREALGWVEAAERTVASVSNSLQRLLFASVQHKETAE